MNKFKKLAVAAVSVVMAGTMVTSLVACGKKNGNTVYSPSDFNVLNADGSLNYNTYTERGNVGLNVAIGHNNEVTSTAFHSLGDAIYLPNSTTAYTDGQMKPAWEQMGKDLNITWNDVWGYQQTSKNLDWLLTTQENGVSKYSQTDLFTTDLSVAVSKSNSGEADILNLADYLDYMPNFKKFLNDNPVVYLSLLQDGMNTTNGEGQKILVAPYFDGMGDIERYCIIRHDWAAKLLGGKLEISEKGVKKDITYSPVAGTSAKFSEQCAAATHVTAFMGSADYTVDALTADGSATQKITKKYSAAAAAAKDGSTPLGTAYAAIAGGAYGGDSGNIIDIMNAALNGHDATGAQLLALYRAYIDVCYQDKDGKAIFNDANRANLFIGYEACWDVDDLVAMLRCVKTNAGELIDEGKVLGGIAPRSGESDRTSDIVSLACQLYGVRGGTSRNEFTYIAADGSIKDARNDKNFYEAMAKMNNMFQEKLIADYSSKSNFATGSGIDTKTGNYNEYFMVYDYSQTQTLNGFYVENSNISGAPKGIPDDYYFAPVLTPVSKWDVNADNSIAADEYFRFTESWRSTKTGGLSANGAVRYDQKKLDATLQFIDYLYSKDGQIVSTFGPMASDANGTGGFWYNEVAGANDTNVFTYKGVKYKGTEYKGEYTPTITEGLKNSFKGFEVNGWSVGKNSKVSNAKLNFTNYARELIGSTLPIGVKDQSLENQLTSEMGKKGADVVGVAIDKGVVKGMSLKLDANNYWYTCVPTGLPVSSTNQTALDSTTQKPFQYLTGTQKDGKGFFSIMNWIVLNGTNAKYNEQDVAVSYTSIDNLLEQTLGAGATNIKALATQRETIYNAAWTQAKAYWTYLSK